jgi:hypothetical protein
MRDYLPLFPFDREARLTASRFACSVRSSMPRAKLVPRWLRRLDLVKEELKAWPFPRTAEEGLRQCAALSASNLKIFYDTGGGRPDRLLDKLRQADAGRSSVWKKDCARAFRR